MAKKTADCLINNDYQSQDPNKLGFRCAKWPFSAWTQSLNPREHKYMLVFVTILNNIFKTYLEALKRDLGKEGFKMILMLAVLSWMGIFLIVALVSLGEFQMPIDPLFYIYWLSLVFLTEISFTLFLLGMLDTTFFIASSLGNISFAITAVYAGFLLNETYATIQVEAIIIALVGSSLFFKKDDFKKLFIGNKGIFLILFSLLITPLEYVLYKSATLHSGSYHQFLTGRLTMDLVFFTLFFAITSFLFSKQNSISKISSFVSSRNALPFLVGMTCAELLESWLIFRIPISLFSILGTLSIPAAYFIGKKKYKESRDWYHILGATLIVLGVVLFVK